MDDRAQIEDIIYAYATLLDDGDWDGLSNLFERGELVIQISKKDQLVLRGAAEVKAWLGANIRLYENGSPKISHVNTNVRIQVADDGRTAKAQTYVTVLQKVPNISTKTVQVILSGRYHDDFTKIDGEWTLTRRQEIAVAVGDMSAHAVGA